MKLPANCFPEPFLAHAKQHEKIIIKKLTKTEQKKSLKKPFKVAKIEGVQQVTVVSWLDDKLSGGEEFLDLTNPIWRLRFSLQIFRSQSQDEKIR